MNESITIREELKSLLIRCLPQRVNASDHKSTVNNRENRNRDRLYALENNKFIYFNSPKRVTLMIFDIDKINGKKAIDIYSLEEMKNHILEITNYLPTYLLQTEKGYHFAFHLKNQIFLDQNKAKKYLQDIKRAITKKLSCDKNGSHRLFGVWRNPLQHKSYYSGHKDFTLNMFKHLVDYKSFSRPSNQNAKTTKKGLLKVHINQLVEGNRNITLLKFAVNYCLVNTKCSKQNLHNYLTHLNKQTKPPLEDKETENIINYIYGRKEKGTLFHPKYKDDDRDIQRGIMNNEEMKGLKYEDYLKEVKKRQSKSAIRTNSLTSKQIKRERMEYARKIQIEQKGSEYLHVIKKAISCLKEQNKKLSYVNIARESNIDRRTIKKYVLQYNLLN